jgi:hypothetical protein
VIIESNADLANAKVQALFKIHEGVVAPYCVLNLLTRDEFALMAQEEYQNASRLLLNPDKRTFPAQF